MRIWGQRSAVFADRAANRLTGFADRLRMGMAFR